MFLQHLTKPKFSKEVKFIRFFLLSWLLGTYHYHQNGYNGISLYSTNFSFDANIFMAVLTLSLIISKQNLVIEKIIRKCF